MSCVLLYAGFQLQRAHPARRKRIRHVERIRCVESTGGRQHVRLAHVTRGVVVAARDQHADLIRIDQDAVAGSQRIRPAARQAVLRGVDEISPISTRVFDVVHPAAVADFGVMAGDFRVWQHPGVIAPGRCFPLFLKFWRLAPLLRRRR